MKKVLIILSLIMMVVGCSIKTVSDEDYVKTRVNDFFNEVENGHYEKAKEYLTGEAKEFVESIDIGKMASAYMGPLSFVGIPSIATNEIMGKFLKEAFKSHEIIEIKRTSDNTYGVDVKVEMFDLDKLSDGINNIDISKLLGNNFMDILKSIINGDEKAIGELVNNILDNFKDFTNYSKEDLMGTTILNLELIYENDKWYISKIHR